MILKIIYIVLLLFLVGFYIIAPTNINIPVILTLLCIVGLVLSLFFIRKENSQSLKKQYLKHSTFVIIGLIIVNFQFPLDLILGYDDGSDSFIWINSSAVTKSIILAVIGLVSFLLGYLFYESHKEIKKIEIERPVSSFFLIIISVFFLVTYFLTVNPLYLVGAYGKVEMGLTAGYAVIGFNLLITATIIQKTRNFLLLKQIPSNFGDYLKKIGFSTIFIIAIYLISVLLSGDRGPFMYFGILILASFCFVTKKRFSLKNMLFFLFFGAFFITLLGIVRAQDSNYHNFSERVRLALSDDRNKVESISPQTREMAASIRTLIASVYNVPEKYDYVYGRFQFQQLTYSVPFLSNLSYLIFDDTSAKYSTSSSYITWLIQGEFPSYGDGSNCIADFYLDFGVLGVIVGMCFFGFYMRYAELSLYSENLPSLFAHVFSLVYLCSAIYIARGMVLFEFSNVIKILIILIINQKISRKI